MLVKNLILYYFLIFCLFSSCQTNIGKEKNMTYRIFDDWKNSVLKSIENLELSTDDKYIVYNYKQCLNSIDKNSFDTLISNINLNKIDALYVTLYISEGEINTLTLKVLAVKESENIHYGQCIIELKEKEFSFGVIDKQYNSKLANDIKLLSGQETLIAHDDDVLFVTEFNEHDDTRTLYIPINIDNYKLLDW